MGISELVSATTPYFQFAMLLFTPGFTSSVTHDDDTVALIVKAVSVCISTHAQCWYPIRHGELYAISEVFSEILHSHQ